MREIADHIATVVATPLTGSLDRGSVMESPKLVLKVDNKSEANKTVITPAKILPQEIPSIIFKSFYFHT
ncbi:hypothetical protein [Candidatus Williamhamiltonella defendens]|uniref:hypothetical protein n=1 Tax=Candidatus Williamhamiltonella defendens TaxID=138072 RepID=UPI001C9D7193|nr:hypothetical protein [Candidatus Hamiltonella defensa]